MRVLNCMGIRVVIRRLFSSPGFTVVALLTIAIAVGANSAIFSVINGVILKPLPYSEPDQLVALNHVAPGFTGLGRTQCAPFFYFTYRERSQAFAAVGMWKLATATITGRAEPERVDLLSVTDTILQMLRIPPALGRIFTSADDRPGSAPTAMLSYGYWQSKFGGDPGVVGRSVMLDGEPREIIGILPQDFWFFDIHPAVVQTLRWDRNKIYLCQFGDAGIGRLDR